jgi:DnaJ-class molecular chaperone
MSERCSTCGGTGRIKTVDAGGKEVDVECGTCGGRGTVRSSGDDDD